MKIGLATQHAVCHSCLHAICPLWESTRQSLDSQPNSSVELSMGPWAFCAGR